MTNQQIAEELLKVLCNSQYHNPAWALKETLEKLRDLLSSGSLPDSRDECEVSYCNGYDDALNEIDKICEELKLL